VSERLGPAPPAAVRLVLVSRDAMLAVAFQSLVEPTGEVTLLDWHATGLEEAAAGADAVVLDLPLELYAEKLPALGRFRGRTVLLLQEGESADDLPAAPARLVLYRPLEIAVLWEAVTGIPPAQPGPASEEPAPASGAPPGPPPMIGMSGRQLESMVGPGQVAPGMDPDTLDRLRRWRDQATPADAASPAAPPPEPDQGRDRA
jgi:hypothetical protein